MGRHVNEEVEVDALPASAVAGSSAPIERPLAPQAVISPDTHVGVDFDAPAPGTPDAAPSPAHPDSLIRNGLVGDGTELE